MLAQLGLLRASMEVWGGARMLLALLLFSGPRERTAASPTSGGVKCIYYNEEYLICDWAIKGKPAVNYSLYYWYSGSGNSPITECKRYLQTDDGINTGCRLDGGEIETCCSFNVYVNASHTNPIPIQLGLLQHLVKPDPPINFTVQNKSDNQLELTWSTTYHPPHCLAHAVKYRTNKDSEWTEQIVPGMKFNIPSVDPKKFYTFYVRSKVNQNCGTTKLWSEMTGPIYWGEKTTDGSAWFWIRNVLFPIGSFVLLLAFLVLLMRMERVWLVLMPRIPNPSKRFEDLFTAYQGNFSEWAGVSKDAVESFKPNYRESICRVSELLPGGGYLPVSNDAAGKAGWVPGGSTDHIPKISPE
ncbi:cytokine receptor common subunit gamma [Tiliqua scincoides]|uniref:cytokine receptor common subunit gamma n=1 Tax=Tiliqua scincoides TaxID=71010 RepID=UPI0034637BD6